MTILFQKGKPVPYHYYHHGKASSFMKFPEENGVLLFSALDTSEELNIANYIETKGIPTAIFPIPLMHKVIRFSAGKEVKLTIGNDSIPLNRIGSAWYLSGIDFPMEKNSNTEDYFFIIDEWRSSISDFFSQLEIKWINTPSRTSISRNALLRLAAQIGFEVPESIVTNDYVEAKLFCKAHGKCILKRVGHSFPALPTGEIFPIYNQRLSFSDLTYNGFSDTPVMIQKEIEKKYEYRVYFIQEDIIGFRVKCEDWIDWRERSAANLLWETIKLSECVEKKISRLMKLLGLNYAAIDFIEGTTGTLFFLEVNPNGTHIFLDNKVRPRISERIGDALIDLLHQEK